MKFKNLLFIMTIFAANNISADPAEFAKEAAEQIAREDAEERQARIESLATHMAQQADEHDREVRRQRIQTIKNFFGSLWYSSKSAAKFVTFQSESLSEALTGASTISTIIACGYYGYKYRTQVKFVTSPTNWAYAIAAGVVIKSTLL